MTRDDLYGHYRRYYRPNNASLVIVGDVDADEAVRLVERRFGALEAGPDPKRVRTAEPAQLGERRVKIEKEGTTAYLKAAWHAPGSREADFVPMLVLDAILTGAKGVNIWCSFRGAAPQRKARLYRALVDRRPRVVGLRRAAADRASVSCTGSSATANDGIPLADVEAALEVDVEDVRATGVTPRGGGARETAAARAAVFEKDSVTNIAHQLGYFQTVASIDMLASLASGDRSRDRGPGGRAARRRLTRTAPDDRLVPAGDHDDRSRPGLSPVRQVLPNGTVALAQESPATPAVTINATMHDGQRPRAPDDARSVVRHVTSHRSGSGRARRRRDRRSARGTRRQPEHYRDAPRDQRDGDEPGRGFRRDRRHRVGRTSSVRFFPRSRSGCAGPRSSRSSARTRTIRPSARFMRCSGCCTAEDHPYGRPAKGTLASIERIDRGALVRFHQGCFSPASLVVAVVGAVDPQTAIDRVTRAFGSFAGGAGLTTGPSDDDEPV